MRGKIGDEQRLIHIDEAISEIEKYTKDNDFEEFRKKEVSPTLNGGIFRDYATSLFTNILGLTVNSSGKLLKLTFPI